MERWFAELTQKKLKRGVHRSVQALERDIRSWLADWNEHPRPFIWTKTADEILDEGAAYCRLLPTDLRLRSLAGERLGSRSRSAGWVGQMPMEAISMGER